MTVKKFRISVFPPKTPIANVMGSNGVILDSICTKCTTEEECSTTGDYTLDAEFVNGNPLSDKIYEDCILKVLMDYGYEIFRIVKYNPKLKRIVVMAKQITIEEQKALWLDDVRPTDSNGQAALNHMLTNSIGTKEIILESDINITNTAYYECIDLYKACFDCDQSFANRWGKNGLEVTRRANKITFNTSRGLKKNLTVRERKNLTGFSGNANIDSYVTRGIGQGYNGIKGHYIESPKKDSYSRIKTKVFKYDDVKVRTKDMSADEEGAIFDTLAEAQAELDRRVQAEFSTNHVDDIQATYNVDFVQLESTEEYKEYSYLEKADCGDYVKVQIPSIGIDITVRVMKKTYDVLKQRTVDMQLSNLPLQSSISTATILNNLKKEYKETGNSDINRYVTAMLEAGLQDSHVILRNNEILIMDTKDINTSKNIWRWNGKALAHSSEGYYSNNWNIGITQDGVINASMILTGILSTVLIQNRDGSFKLDLSNSGGCNFYNNNKLALKIYNNLLEFYNWGTSGNYIGSLGSTTLHGDSNGTPCIEWWHDPNLSCLTIGYKLNESDSVRDYVNFDKNMKINKKASIEIKESVAMIDNIDMNGYYFYINKEKYPNLYLIPSTNGWLWCNSGFVVNGDFECKGNKKCIQSTENYGDVSFYATEDMDSYLTYTSPIGKEYKCIESKEEGLYKCIAKIPQIVKETINTNLEYRVYINKLSFGDYKIKTYPSYFVVTSDKPLIFQYYIRGIRKGFENELLENNMQKYEDKLNNRAKTLYTYRQSKKAGNEWINNGMCDEG